MATPRTATTKWKRIRKEVIAEAKDNGQTKCPICGVRLEWKTAQRPRSVEVDHRIPVVAGGTDDAHNLRCICRSCNGSKDSGNNRKRTTGQPSDEPAEVFVNPRW